MTRVSSSPRNRFAIARLVGVASLIAVAGLAGCDLWPFGPSKTVAGTWRAPALKTLIYEMSLTQDGDDISGVVCGYNVGFRPSEAKVTGTYPNVAFDVPLVANCRFEGKFEEDREQIAGDCATGFLLRFERSATGRCESAPAASTP